MCKLIIATKKATQSTELKNLELKNLLHAQFDLIKKQKDGLGILTIDNKNKIQTTRVLQVHEYNCAFYKMLKEINNKKLIAIHSRMATTGDVVQENIHFFKRKGLYMAQNGTVEEYASGYGSYYDAKSTGREWWNKDQKNNKKNKLDDKIEKINDEIVDYDDRIDKQLFKIDSCPQCQKKDKGACKSHDNVLRVVNYLESKKTVLENEVILKESKQLEYTETDTEEITKVNKCDTLQFLEGLKKPVNTETLLKAMSDKAHRGSSFILDEQNREAHFLAGTTAKMIYNKDYTCLFSYEPEMDLDTIETYKHKGITLERGVEVGLKMNIHDIQTGVYKMQVDRG